jgi:acyl carrier protein
MTPSAVVWHESLALTPNGKVDRGKLAATAPLTQAAAGAAAAGAGEPTGLELELAELWAPVLRIPAASIGRDSSFFDLGGDSLAAARVFTRVRKEYGVSITLDRLYEVQTVQAMAACIQAGLAARPEAAGAA